MAPDPAPVRGLLRALLAGDGRRPRPWRRGVRRSRAPCARPARPGPGVGRRRPAAAGAHRPRAARAVRRSTPRRPGSGRPSRRRRPGMSPGRIQEILAAAGLPATHDPVSAVAVADRACSPTARGWPRCSTAPPRRPWRCWTGWCGGRRTGQVTAEPARRRAVAAATAGCCCPSAPRTVVLPREVALHLRGGRAHRAPEPLPPRRRAAARAPSTGGGRDGGRAGVHRAGHRRGAAEGAGTRAGPPVLRAGGLSVRDLKRTAAALDVSEPVAAFWVELAYAAGLMASDGEADERYAPTPAYDEWLELPASRRWARARRRAWLAATRTPGLVGGRDAKGRTLSALGPDLDRRAAPEVRHRRAGPAGRAPGGRGPDRETLLARLRWERPLRGAAAAGTRRGPARPARPVDAGRGRAARRHGTGALSAQGRALLGAPAAPAKPAEPTGPGDKLPGPPPRPHDRRRAARPRARSHRPSRPSPPPPPPGCSRRCCPSRWTTSCSRPT